MYRYGMNQTTIEVNYHSPRMDRSRPIKCLCSHIVLEHAIEDGVCLECECDGFVSVSKIRKGFEIEVKA